MKRSIAAIAALLSIALATSVAHAQTAAATAANTAGTAATVTAGTPASSPVFGMMQGLFGLAVVIALIFAAGWLMKKIAPRARGNSIVQVIGGASVGPREKVVVVRFGAQTLLLGVAPGHVGLLHAAEAADLLDSSTPNATAPNTPRFIDRLRAARSHA